MELKKYSVEIGGMRYTIRSDQNETLVKDASLFVQQQLTDFLEKSTRITEKDAIVLIALKLATEYLKINQEQALLALKITSLLEMLEQAE